MSDQRIMTTCGQAAGGDAAMARARGRALSGRCPAAAARAREGQQVALGGHAMVGQGRVHPLQPGDV